MAREASARARMALPSTIDAHTRGIAEAMPLVVWTADGDGRIDYVNQRWCAYAGVDFDEAFAAGWHGLVHADDIERTLAWWQARLMGAREPLVVRLRRGHDGALRRHRLSAEPLPQAPGAPAGWLGCASDEEDTLAAADEHARLSNLVEAQARIYNADLDLDHALELVADEILRLTPAEGAAIAQRDGDEVCFRATRGASTALKDQRLPLDGSLVGKALRSRRLVRTSNTRTEGDAHRATASRIGPRSLVIVPLGELGGAELALVVASSDPAAFADRDVAALQLLASVLVTAVANAARSRSERRYRALIETMNEGVWQTDRDGRITFANAHLARMLGYTVEELQGRSFFDLVDREHVTAARRHFVQRRAGQATSFDLILRRKDGAPLWVAKTGAPLLDERGAVIGSIAAITDVSERRQLEQQVIEQMHTYGAILTAQGQVGLGFGVVDAETRRFVHVSDTLAQIYGYRPDELLAFESYMVLVPPELLEENYARMRRRGSVTERDFYEAVHVDKRGRRLHVEVARVPMDDRRAVVVVRNIGERVRAQEELRRSSDEVVAAARRLQLLLSNVESAVLLSDGERVRFVNHAFEELMGVASDEIIGRTRPEVVARLAQNFDDPAQFVGQTQHTVNGPVNFDVQIEMQRPRRRVLRWRGRVVELADGRSQFVSFTDITAETELARDRETQARTDTLTGLLNRRGGELALDEALARARRDGHTVSLLLADIDHFKQVNDTYGHDVGDTVITAVARALAHTVRSGDVVARWGGEELLVLLPRAGVNEARQVAERCRAAVAAMRIVEAPGLAATLSLGAAEVGDDEPLAGALRRADAALYRAKRQGRNRVG